MKKISLIIIFVFLWSLILKASDSTFTISGKLDKIKKGKLLLTIYSGEAQVKDSALVINGMFHFVGKTSDASMAVLTLHNKENDYLVFYLEPKNIIITGVGDSLKLLTISGSPINDDNKLLKQRMEYITKWENNNSNLFGEANKAKNKAIMDSLDEVDNEVLKEKRKITAAFVKEYPSSMLSAIAITENYGYYAEASEVEPLYNVLDANIQNSSKGIEIKKLIEVYQTVALGRVAPDFTQLTPEGTSLTLSSLKGKYVLVDFWASWCGPCRRENPNVVKTYTDFHKKGFEIFGVSYDTKKERWTKAIKDDGLAWYQVSDLQGWKNSTSALYGIKAIPANLLLDKEGKIIAKNIFGKNLSAKLNELFP